MSIKIEVSDSDASEAVLFKGIYHTAQRDYRIWMVDECLSWNPADILGTRTDKHEGKTLAELNVQPGDVVEFIGDETFPDKIVSTIAGWSGGQCYDTTMEFGGDTALRDDAVFRIISRASNLKPTAVQPVSDETSMQEVQEQAERDHAAYQKDRLERIATAAMQGILANPNTSCNGRSKISLLMDAVVTTSIDCARALIAELDGEAGE